MKKFLAMVLAAIMILCVVLPALAANNEKPVIFFNRQPSTARPASWTWKP